MALFLAALSVAALDQLSKTWIRCFSEGQPIWQAGFFRIVHTHNTGAAFGLLQGHSFALTIVAFVGIAAILTYALLLSPRFPLLSSKLARVALGLVLGGTIGNLADRLRFGYVTDFVDLGFWPAFNAADSAITVGAILLAYFLLSLSRTDKQEA